MRRDNIMIELEAHNSADDNSNDTIMHIIKLASNAHEHFLLSKIEEKRKILKMVFSTLKLNGQKLEFKLHPPFDLCMKLPENEEWRALKDSNL